MSEQNQNSQNEKKAQSDYQNGMALTVGLHMIFGIVILGLMFIGNTLSPLPWLILIGVTQLIYIIPAMVIAHFAGKTYLVKGLLIGASVTFLVNAACTGLVIIFNWAKYF